MSAILPKLIKYYILKELKDLDKIPSKVLQISLWSSSFAFSSWEHGFLIPARAHQSSCISSSQCNTLKKLKSDKLHTKNGNHACKKQAYNPKKAENL